jgi:surfactin synthase thioesterase subunit
MVAYGLASVERKVKSEVQKIPRFAPKVKLHSGFWDMYNSIRNPLHEFIRTELVLEPTDLFVTGHCLGGALATICALDLSIHTVAPINLFLNSNHSKSTHKRRRR